MVGAFEAGFYPTAVGYLSSFYSRYDMGIRVALFFGQYAVAGAFSGPYYLNSGTERED